MTTETLYMLMLRSKCTHSRRHLSTELLGAAHNYATSNRDARPSDTAMLHLIRWLCDRRRYILAAHCLQMVVWPDRPDRKLWWLR